jgi:ech hydrogenase subunit F
MNRFPAISKTIMKSLVGKPATRMYPQQKRTNFPATRGKVDNDILKCIFCSLCERDCPTAAIQVNKKEMKWVIDSLKCCACRRCVEVCPKKCLSMDNVYFPPVRSRSDGIYLRVAPPGHKIERETSKKAPVEQPEGV